MNNKPSSVKEGIRQHMEGTNVTTLPGRGKSVAPVITERQYLTVKEVSDYTGLATGTLYNMVSQRRIPHRKLGRLVKFERSELDRWLRDQSVKVRRPLAAA